MLPHKTERGKCALERLKVFEGMPFPYSNKKKAYVAKATKCIRLRNDRKYWILGELCQKIGWNKGEIVAKLESKREEKASEYYKNKV